MDTKYRHYTLDKFLGEEEIKIKEPTNPKSMDNYLEDIYKKTDKISASLEGYIDDVARFQKKINDFQNKEGVSMEDFLKTTTTINLIMKRLEDMEIYIEKVGKSIEQIN